MTPTTAPHLEPTTSTTERVARRKTLRLLTLLDDAPPHGEV